MNNKLFINDQLQTYFNENGFIILRGVINNEIDVIKKIYKEYLENKNKIGLYESTGSNNNEINILISNKIKKTLEPLVKNIFQNYNFYGGAFLVKSPINSKELHLHQDWSFVDEKKDDALFFWMPLHNVDKENGTIYLIPKSNLFFDIIRSGSYPSRYINRYLIPKKYINTINLCAGDIFPTNNLSNITNLLQEHKLELINKTIVTDNVVKSIETNPDLSLIQRIWHYIFLEKGNLGFTKKSTFYKKLVSHELEYILFVFCKIV